MFLATKAMDTTRPVLDASGYSHRVPETDVFDCHDYDQNVDDVSAQRHAARGRGQALLQPRSRPRLGLSHMPGSRSLSVSLAAHGGTRPPLPTRDRTHILGLRQCSRALLRKCTSASRACVSALLDDPAMFGYCYTQLTDVYQEQNGIYTFDRAAQVRPAASARHPNRPRRH